MEALMTTLDGPLEGHAAAAQCERWIGLLRSLESRLEGQMSQHKLNREEFSRAWPLALAAQAAQQILNSKYQ